MASTRTPRISYEILTHQQRATHNRCVMFHNSPEICEPDQIEKQTGSNLHDTVLNFKRLRCF